MGLMNFFLVPDTATTKSSTVFDSNLLRVVWVVENILFLFYYILHVTKVMIAVITKTTYKLHLDMIALQHSKLGIYLPTDMQ